ncbi:hypothetical protein N0V93_006577 [Gnomoniopsis smithogilvyi]|uniref:Mitochondrial import inner membrane translocase subunit TIM50 n=1 Tax=Gnomoniopsis smithogilvyi TaxID=1191159 RepID=A0A9W8YS57_9PEZI|nr:hypothetical protein N0V93_006577 [Gnomoniopsis smithogilvyi]
MNQLDGSRTQVKKDHRGDQIQQNSAEAHKYFAGVNGYLAQSFPQQTNPLWPPMHSNMGPSGANQGTGYNGAPMPNAFNPSNMDPAQSHVSSDFLPQFLTPSMGTPSNMNTGSFTPAHSVWALAGAPQQGQLAKGNPFLDNQFAAFSQQNAISTPAGSAQNVSNMPTISVTKKTTSAAADRHRLEITAPSQESGGVPDPTDAYLMRASFLPKRRNQPGPLLVVIDLNGTLLYRPSRKNSTSFQSRRHAQEFVTYCVQTFWVVFWSSAKPENVKGMVNQLLSKPLRKQVVGVWGRDKFGLTEQDYNKRTQCYKRLTKLWNDPLIMSTYPKKRPGFEGGCWDQGNTVLIDDSVEKARSEPHNAITLPEYTGGIDDKGDVLPSVHDYLNELCYQEDVSAFMRAHPFKMA